MVIKGFTFWTLAKYYDKEKWIRIDSFIVVLYFYILFFVLKNGNLNLRIPIFVIGISLLSQIVLGVLTILSGVKMLYASLHQINSILIILSTLYFLYITKYKEDIY